MDVSIVIPGHSEGILAHRTLLAARAAADVAIAAGLSVEIIGILDRATEETKQVYEQHCSWCEYVDYGDLGLTRNHGTAIANGKCIAFCDGDDLFGLTWVLDAFRKSETLGDVVLHPQLNVFFGELPEVFIREHIGTDDPVYSPDWMVQYNIWSALCFARRSLLLKFPYIRRQHGCGYEDWQFNLDTLSHGIQHLVVPNTVHWIRIKDADQSLCRSLQATRTVVGPNRYLQNPRPPGAPTNYVRDTVIDHLWFAKEMMAANRIDPMCWLPEGKQVKFEPTPTPNVAQSIWSALKIARSGDVIIVVPTLDTGGVTNVVKNIVAFYATRGIEPLVIVTESEQAPEICGARVISFFAGCGHLRLTAAERAFAVQKVLVQIGPVAIHAVNSALAVTVLRMNPECIRRTAKFFFWNFGLQHMQSGRLAAAAFWDLPYVWKHVNRVITDSKAWAQRLRDMYGYPDHLITSIRQPVEHINVTTRDWEAEHLTVLWAGRLEPEKGTKLLFDVAAAALKQGYVVKFAVAGSGTDEDQVKRAPYIFDYWGPFKKLSDLPLYRAHLFLMTSPAEGAPQTMLEAQSAGLICVVPDVGGMPEINYGGSTADRTAEALLHEILVMARANWRVELPSLSANVIRETRDLHSVKNFEMDLQSIVGPL